MKNLNKVISVKSEIHHKLRVFAAKSNKSIAQVTESAILTYIGKNG